MESRRDSVQKETHAVSATTTVIVERRHNRPLLFQGRRLKMTEGDFRKESPPDAAVLLEGEIKNRADTTLKETGRIRRVTIGT